MTATYWEDPLFRALALATQQVMRGEIPPPTDVRHPVAESQAALRRAQGLKRRKEAATMAARRKGTRDWYHPAHGHRRAWHKDMCAEFGGSAHSWWCVVAGYSGSIFGWRLVAPEDVPDT